MKTTFRFYFPVHPDCKEFVDFQIPAGATKEEIAVMCSEADGVSATCDEIMESQWMVDGNPLREGYIFTGKEEHVDLLALLAMGC